MAKKETELKNELRNNEVGRILNLLIENDFVDCGLIANNKITYPTLDSEHNERDIVITISIPSGQRGGDNFDGQAEIEIYAEKVANAEKEKAKKKKSGE